MKSSSMEMESLPAFAETDICETHEQLLESYPLSRFLSAYNQHMQHRNPQWEEVTVEMLENDYNLARKVADDALDWKLPGGISLNIVSRIKDLIEEGLDAIRSRDLDRVLSFEELCERIPGFVEMMDKCEAAYVDAGYDEALRRAGVIAPDEEYTVPVPKITEMDMVVMAELARNNPGFLKKMVIDDDRLSDAETLAHFHYKGRDLPKRIQHIADTKAVNGHDFETLERTLTEDSSGAKIQRTFAKLMEEKGDSVRSARLMFYSHSGEGLGNIGMSGKESYSSEKRRKRHQLPMSLGQLLRLEAFLKVNDPENLDKLYSIYIRTAEIEQANATVILNNILPSGNALCITPSEKPKGKPRFSQINPGKTEVWSTVKDVTVFPAGVNVKNTYEVGQKLVYPAQGVVEVLDIEEKQLGGKLHVYYVLRVEDTGRKVMLPLVNAEFAGLRTLMTEKEVEQVFDIIKMPMLCPDNHAWQRRYRQFMDKIKSGDINEVAEVLRDLLVQRREKQLSFGERRMLTTVRGMICREIAMVRGQSEEDVWSDILWKFEAN